MSFNKCSSFLFRFIFLCLVSLLVFSLLFSAFISPRVLVFAIIFLISILCCLLFFDLLIMHPPVFSHLLHLSHPLLFPLSLLSFFSIRSLIETRSVFSPIVTLYSSTFFSFNFMYFVSLLNNLDHPFFLFSFLLHRFISFYHSYLFSFQFPHHYFLFLCLLFFLSFVSFYFLFSTLFVFSFLHYFVFFLLFFF